MALIRCPECGKDISDKSAFCVHCGYPVRELGIPEPAIPEPMIPEPPVPEPPVPERAPVELVAVDVPKRKYVLWLFVLAAIAIAANTLYGRESSAWYWYVIDFALAALPGLILLLDSRGKKIPARILAIVYAIPMIGQYGYYCIVYGARSFLFQTILNIMFCGYLCVYAFRGSKHRDSLIWFILGCVAVALFYILPYFVKPSYYDSILERTFDRIAVLFIIPCCVVGFCPEKWFRKYRIPKRTWKFVMFARLGALGATALSLVFQLIGSAAVSSAEYLNIYRNYSWKYYLTPEESRIIEEVAAPRTTQFYRDNTISIILACIAGSLFAATLIIVLVMKHRYAAAEETAEAPVNPEDAEQGGNTNEEEMCVSGSSAAGDLSAAGRVQ